MAKKVQSNVKVKTYKKYFIVNGDNDDDDDDDDDDFLGRMVDQQKSLIDTIVIVS